MCLLRTQRHGCQIYKLRFQLRIDPVSAWSVRRYSNVRCTMSDYQGATSSQYQSYTLYCKFLFPFLDPPYLHFALVLHIPDCVRYCLSFGNLLPGNQLPAFLIAMAVDCLYGVPYKFFLVWLLHGMVKIHGISVFTGHIVDKVVHLLLSGVVLFICFRVEVGRLYCIVHVSIS